MFQFFDNYFFGPAFTGMFKDGEDYLIKRDWSALNIFYTLLNIIMNMLELDLDLSMNERYMMLNFISTGMCGIAPIDNEVLNLGVQEMNNQSRYGLPVNVGLIDYTGKYYGRFIPYDGTNEDYADCVIVYWNKEHTPPIARLVYYANRLLELDCAISAAISNLKATVVVTCEKEQEEVVAKAWEEARKGKPVIVTYNGSSDFGNKPELMVNNLTGDILKQLMETYDKCIADFCIEFGINANVVMNKLSGISDKELAQTDQRTSITQNGILNEIKKGFEDANRLFGTTCSVDFNYDIIENGNNTQETSEEQEEDTNADEENI